jgi:hypothetical protein
VATKSQNLSTPLTQRQQDLAIKREQARQQAAKQAKAEMKQPVTKIMPNNMQTPVTPTNQATNKGIDNMRSQAAKPQTAASSNTAQPSHNKGIEAARQKASIKQSGINKNHLSNQGIKSYQDKTRMQSASSSKNITSVNDSKSGAISKGSQKNNSGQER